MVYLINYAFIYNINKTNIAKIYIKINLNLITKLYFY
jgi:hypothetical protein